jgi:hypothetical protein
MFPEGPPPEVTVIQDVNQFGVRSYTSIVQETITLPVSVYGGCNANFRAHKAYVEECFQQLDGGGGLVQACLPIGEMFDQDFEVSQSAKKFGPGVVPIEVPRQFLSEHLTQAGEDLIAKLAAQTEFSAGAWRSVDLRVPVDWDLTFIMQCRRWFGGNQVHSQSSYAVLPMMVTYRGLPGNVPDLLPPDNDPPQQPTFPNPVGAFTSATRIEQAQLSILPDPARDPCGYALSGTFVTNAPTEVRYQVVDHLGARSKEFTVEVDQILVAFVSHEIEFAEGGTEPIGFAAAESGAGDADGLAFSNTFLANPTDNIQGFYRLETLAPHVAQSNVVSYNLEDCSGANGRRAPAFEAVVLGDPARIAEVLRRESEGETGYKEN